MKRGKSFEEGNTAALKWTLDEIKKTLMLIDDYLYATAEGKKCNYIGEALAQVSRDNKIRLYPELWAYWTNTLDKPIDCKPEDESNATRKERVSVFKLLKNIEGTIQSRLIVKAVNMKASTGMAIFILKNQGWSDQQHLDVTTDGDKVNKFDGTVSISVTNTNPNIEINSEGEIVKDNTDEIAKE